MKAGLGAAAPDFRARAALLAGATVWGVLRYPYRVRIEAGVGGLAASVLSYAVAFAAGLPAFLRRGGCNVGYVLAMLDGEVMACCCCSTGFRYGRPCFRGCCPASARARWNGSAAS